MLLGCGLTDKNQVQLVLIASSSLEATNIGQRPRW